MHSQGYQRELQFKSDALICNLSCRSIFQETVHDRVDKCNTEKSKHYQRKNFRTAGTGTEICTTRHRVVAPQKRSIVFVCVCVCV